MLVRSWNKVTISNQIAYHSVQLLLFNNYINISAVSGSLLQYYNYPGSKSPRAECDVCDLAKCSTIHALFGNRRHIPPFWIVSPVCDCLVNSLCIIRGAPKRKVLPLIQPWRVLSCLQSSKFLCPRLSVITQLLVECHKWNLVYCTEFIMLGQTLLLFVGKRWKWSQEYYNSLLDNFSTLTHCL